MDISAFHKNLKYRAEGRSAIINKNAHGKDILEQKTALAVALKESGVNQADVLRLIFGTVELRICKA